MGWEIKDHRPAEGYDPLHTVSIKGGAAYGLAMLGQLAALQESGITPMAWSGSSAGAVIATLGWAGYSAEEILQILQQAAAEHPDQGLAHLLGPFDQAALLDRRPAPLTPGRLAGTAQELRRRLRRGPISALLTMRRLRRSLPPLLAGFEAEGCGLFRARAILDLLDRLLEARLARLESRAPRPGARPRFKDFADARPGLPVLMITVTDLLRRELVAITAPDLRFDPLIISDVVRASIAIPGLLKPQALALIRRRSDGALATAGEIAESPESVEAVETPSADGGVMANFPLWALVQDLRQAAILTGPAIHFGLNLTQPDGLKVLRQERARLSGASGWAMAMAAIVTTGPRSRLEDRINAGVAHAVVINQDYEHARLPGSELDFGQLHPDVMEAMALSGAHAARARLAEARRATLRPWFALPDLEQPLHPGGRSVGSLLRGTADLVAAVLQPWLQPLALRAESLRLLLFCPMQGGRLTLCYGLSSDGEFSLRPGAFWRQSREVLVAQALERRRSLAALVSDQDLPPEAGEGGGQEAAGYVDDWTEEGLAEAEPDPMPPAHRRLLRSVIGLQVETLRLARIGGLAQLLAAPILDPADLQPAAECGEAEGARPPGLILGPPQVGAALGVLALLLPMQSVWSPEPQQEADSPAGRWARAMPEPPALPDALRLAQMVLRQTAEDLAPLLAAGLP